MKILFKTVFLFVSATIQFYHAGAQEPWLLNNGEHRNAPVGSYSQWEMDFTAGGAFTFNNIEKNLFRGNGLATKISGKRFWGNVGLAASSGLITGKINESSINQFLKDRSLSREEMNISASDPHNGYLLFGPSFRFGKKISFNVDMQGGLFLNDAGMLDIVAKGSDRSLYRFDNGTKNYAAGFSGSLSVRYPINSSTHFFVNTDYLQTRTSVNLLDLKNGIDIATQLKRDVKLITAGIGINISLPPDTYQRKHIGGVKYESRMTSVQRDGHCGPVTMTTTRPDGTMQQFTFACPEDALAFSEGDAGNNLRSINTNNSMPSRLSMTPTTARQTQGNSFGEKVASGLQAGAGMISGRISWQQERNPGIITNEMAAVSSIGGMAKPGGAVSSSYAAGIMTKPDSNAHPQIIRSVLYVREGGGGRSTGRRQYQPAFVESMNTSCTGCGLVVKSIDESPVLPEKSEVKNPLYSGSSQSADNPLYKPQQVTGSPLYSGNSSSHANPLYNGSKLKGHGAVCGKTGHFLVSLYDGSGSRVADTHADSCGNFWFANVPEGAYALRVTGETVIHKSYEVSITKDGKYDVGGELQSGDANLVLDLFTQNSDSNVQQSKVIVRGWNPQSKQVITGSQRVAGNPIPGLIVKGGKNPGAQKTVQANSNGQFGFSGWEKGNYIITADIPFQFDQNAIVSVGGGVHHWGDPHENLNGKSEHGDFNSSSSNKETRHELVQSGLTNTIGQVIFSISKDGTLNGKLEAQDYNSTRSNKSYLVIHEDGTISGKCNAQDFNTVRSNRQNMGQIKK